MAMTPHVHISAADFFTVMLYVIAGGLIIRGASMALAGSDNKALQSAGKGLSVIY
jgi:hypothetical protein